MKTQLKIFTKKRIPSVFQSSELKTCYMVYYQCPDCGYKQRSKAQKRVKCHKCGRSYLKRDAKKFDKKTQDMNEKDKKKTGFHKYSKNKDED